MDLSEDLCLARRAAISSISEPLIPPTPKTEYPFACQRRRRRSMTARLTPSSFQNRSKLCPNSSVSGDNPSARLEAAQLGNFLRVPQSSRCNRLRKLGYIN